MKTNVHVAHLDVHLVRKSWNDHTRKEDRVNKRRNTHEEVVEAENYQV
jgi:hypothetical protein